MDKTIMVALISGSFALIGGFFGTGFIQFLITRSDKKETEKKQSRFDIIEKQLKYISQGNIRLQLIVMMKLCPEKHDEIISIGKKYFCDYDGNWYLTDMFVKYLDEHYLTYPLWFNQNKRTEE